MKLTLVSALAVGLLSAAPAFSLTLDFDALSTGDGVGQYYNGGTNSPGSSGSNPLVTGPNYGITFGDDMLVADPTSGGFSGNPSGSVLAPFNSLVASPTTLSINVASGFSGDVSLFYSSVADATVTVYSDLNGGGTALATFNLTANDSACTTTSFCQWDQLTASLGGQVAKSISFTGATDVAGFDNITIAPVPLPAAGWLLVSALGGMGAFRRRRTEA
jgi:hypothetical protein